MAVLSLSTKIRRYLRPPRRYIYVAALVVCVVRYRLILWLFPQFDVPERLFFSGLSLAFIITAWEGIDAFNRFLNRKLPFESGPLRRFLVQSSTCLLFLVGFQTLVIVSFERYYTAYFPPQLAASIKIASYGLNVFVVVAVNTAYFGFYFFEKWKKNLLEQEKWQLERAILQRERLNAQYENLKNQLNPHFLFNSLSSLDGLIDENPALARRFLQQLSKVFRYVLQHKDKELVPLETELAFIQNYVSLLKTRFDGMLEITFRISDDALDKAIVPVTLQVLIENAIKHNIISEASPLTISASTDDTYLTVENRVQRKHQVETSHQQGLRNLTLLYSHLSQQPVEIQEDNSYFRVRVPLL